MQYRSYYQLTLNFIVKSEYSTKCITSYHYYETNESQAVSAK